MTTKKNRRAFTLVELVIVIAVIAVLAAVLVPTFTTVIEKAHNAADLQLVRNMNEIVAGEIAIGETDLSTPDNIRSLLKANGIDEIGTKNDDVVIVYNNESQQFERYKLNSLVESGKSASPMVLTAKAEGSEDAFAEAPYYAEEIFEGKTIVSTSGNALSEALYALHNLPAGEENVAKHVRSAFRKIKNNTIAEKVKEIALYTVFVAADGNMYQLTLTGSGSNASATAKQLKDVSEAVITDTYDSGNGISITPTRVIFSEEITEPVYIENFLKSGTGLQVVVPQHVELQWEEEPLQSTEWEDMPTFCGNIPADLQIPENKKTTLDKAKENAQDPGTSNLINIDQFYVSTLGIDRAVSLAEQAWELTSEENRVDENNNPKFKRVILDEATELTTDLVIPYGVLLDIPYATGSADDKVAIEVEDPITSRPLGEAWPIHDNNPENKDKFYLCGEGPGKNENGGVFAASKNITEEETAYILTINKDVKLTVNGQLRVGGVVGYEAQDAYQGHTSGAYGQIMINAGGNLTIEEGGVLDCFGFIKGEGTMDAKDGATVYEPFIITDYVGALATMYMYPFVGLKTEVPDSEINYSSPFSRYTVMNIQSEMTVHYGAKVYGRAELYAYLVLAGMLCRTDMALIGPEGEEEFALQLSRGAKLVCTYDEKAVLKSEDVNLEDYEKTDTNKAGIVGDIGRTEIEIFGNVSTGAIGMNIFGDKPSISFANFDIPIAKCGYRPINTSNCILPISFNYDFVINENATLDIAGGNKYAIMPGAAVTVNKGGNLIVEEGSELYVLDATYTPSQHKNVSVIDEKLKTQNFANIMFANKYYPSAKLLKASDMSASGNLTVNGTFTAKTGSKVGGIINSTEQTAKIVVEQGVDTSGEFSLGGTEGGAYTPENTIDNQFGQLLVQFVGQASCVYSAVQTNYTFSLRVVTKSADSDSFELTNVEAGNTYNMTGEQGTVSLESVKFEDSADRNQKLLENDTDAKLTKEELKYTDTEQTIIVNTTYTGGWVKAEAAA